MTREDIIRMAKEAGFFTLTAEECIKKTGGVFFGFCDDSIYDELERFAALVAAAEREACAEICDAEASIEGIAQRCATKIRARGSK